MGGKRKRKSTEKIKMRKKKYKMRILAHAPLDSNLFGFRLVDCKKLARCINAILMRMG